MTALLGAGPLAGIAAAEEEHPDLWMRDVWPTSIREGDASFFRASVMNRGNAPTGYFHVVFLLDGARYADVSVRSLAPGEGAIIDAPRWYATAGAHTIEVIADSRNEVRESVEDNNALGERFRVAPKAVTDLAAKGISWNPAQPATGDRVAFSAAIQNGGNVDVRTFTVTFVLDGERYETVRVARLGAGESIHLTAHAWSARPGDHTIEVYVDSGSDIREARESNNYASARLHVGLVGGL